MVLIVWAGGTLRLYIFLQPTSEFQDPVLYPHPVPCLAVSFMDKSWHTHLFNGKAG